MSRPEILLVYDKECPACNAYCQIVRIRESVGDLKIIDARDQSDVLDEITDRGLDIDQGMVLKMGDQLYYGSDAIHALALISRADQEYLIVLTIGCLNQKPFLPGFIRCSVFVVIYYSKYSGRLRLIIWVYQTMRNFKQPHNKTSQSAGFAAAGLNR